MKRFTHFVLAGLTVVVSISAVAASECPTDFKTFDGTTDPLICSCSADAVKADGSGFDTVWGMDVYADRSLICRAARHAGAIGEGGGTVIVVPEVGRKAYPGVKRNGIVSDNDSANPGSFRFSLPARPATQAAVPLQAPAPSPATASPAAPSSAAPSPLVASPSVPTASGAASECPANFKAFNGTTELLACSCSADAVKADGSGFDTVWGMDVYADRSLICRAARHAGVIGEAGGTVTVVPEGGRKAYPGVKRNGIVSDNDSANPGSFRFLPPVRPVTQGAAPVQQPIAASLRERGEVDLYVRFRTASAELDPITLPVLDELRGALAGSPGLNLALIGHTDNVGTREYNLPLSLRRAEAVRFWLADRGVGLARIAVDGRGFDEPIADNATESGRAFNRRVQAKRLP
ncbi:LCCL domain-containing protein [uncultured Methylobacterium sp.]|uniref:LCCL domain-containing protein n=1 Tax=uncultured Methylobacterium sp. TaxID=157278 RepID=UPI0035CC313C